MKHSQETPTSHAVVNAGRRLHRLELAIGSLADTPEERRQFAQHADDLGLVLDSLRARTGGDRDPLLVSFADRLRSLQSLLVGPDRLDALPEPKYQLRAARMRDVPHKDLLAQLRTQVQKKNEAVEANRRRLLDIKPAEAVTPNSTPAASMLGVNAAGAVGVGKNATSPMLARNSLGIQARRPHGSSSEPEKSSDVRQVLAEHEKLQDKLAEDLAGMASALKANALAFSDGLKKDAMVVGEAEEILGNNQARMAKENERLKAQRAASRTTTWMLVLALLVAAVVSVGMFIVIKIF
ncbi:SNAP receptor use1 [Blastocladiella emersonii ATCC 22665]|nr:SNAP receptor use1 [Blastocladiella emersonii ATCC 22665]